MQKSGKRLFIPRFCRSVTISCQTPNVKLNLDMPVLNINQFVERKEEAEVPICPRCRGLMSETPINVYDALKLVFGKKKIIRRYRCADCSQEKRTEL